MRNHSEGEREIVMARCGMPSSHFALMESAKKRATKLEAKGQRVDFNEMLRSEKAGRSPRSVSTEAISCPRLW